MDPYQLPARRTRPRHQGLMAAVGVILAAVMIIVVVTVVYAVSRGDQAPAPRPEPAAATTEAPAVNLGEGTPGAACATNRLGKSFVKDGVTYTCGGARPYHWLP